VTANLIAPPKYPVVFDITYPEAPGRLRILVRWFLAIPQLIISALLESAAELAAFAAFFVILFTRRYPPGLFDFVVGATRWQYNVSSYVLIHDRPYPPFSFDEGDYPPLSYDVERRDLYNRWLPLVKWLLAIPHVIAIVVLSLAAMFVWLAAAVAVVVSGTFPRWAFGYLLGVGRWNARINAYLLLQVDDYPPFSMR
jgi:hypothetical protein